MIGYAISRNKIKIRLTEERWFHISESHDYMSGLTESVLETINEPELLIQGNQEEFIATKRFNNNHIVVIYREVNSEDGFVITAFLTSDVNKIVKNRKIIWKKN